MPSAYVGGAAMILLLPLNWLAAVLCAAVFHELCHFAVLKLCGIPVHQLRIGMSGAAITPGFMTPGQELLCALAGPLGSLSLLLWIRYFPLLSFAGTVQGLFNLLPIYPLDGGRVLRSIFMLAKNRH